jgi:predicted aspartyl protease
MLTAVHLRAGDYALAAAARRESRALIPPSGSVQSDLLAAAEALKATPPMTMTGKPQGMLPLKLEKDRIPRAQVAINGLVQWVALDTGSAFSVVSQSVAKQAGIRPLGAAVSFSATGNHEADAAIGVAGELVIAEAKFSNVVFLIVPDDDLDIFGDQAKVGAIVGLPVFLKMGRIAMLPENGGLIFAFQPSGGQPGAASNMRLHKLVPILSGTLKRPEPAAIGMLLDTGASVTSFYSRFAASFPELVAGAPVVSSTSGVIGEASLSRQARRLGELRFDVGGTAFTITGAKAYADQRPSYDGALGQDILHVGFIADFGTMTFELAPKGAQVKSGAP